MITALSAVGCTALYSVIEMTVIISSTLPAAFHLSTIWTWLGLQHSKLLLISQDTMYFNIFPNPSSGENAILIITCLFLWEREELELFSPSQGPFLIKDL